MSKSYSLNFLPPAGYINVSYMKDRYKNEFKVFDLNHDGEFNKSEVSALKAQVENAAGSDLLLQPKDLEVFAKQNGCDAKSLNSFLHDLYGAILGQHTQTAMNNTIFKIPDPMATKKLVEKINKKNAAEFHYVYTKDFARLTIIDNLCDKVSFSEAKPMIEKVMDATIEACKASGLDVKENAKKYKEALSNNDKEGIKKYGNNICKMLNNRNKAKNYIPTFLSKSDRRAELGAGNRQKLTWLAQDNILDPKEPDLIGDGVLGNHPSYVSNKIKNKTQQKRVALILDTLETLLVDEIWGEKLRSCVTKDRNTLCVYLPKDQATYTYTENGMLNQEVIRRRTIGDGDMSIMVEAVFMEMDRVNFSTDNQEEMAQFILNVFKF